ncbi:DUF3558 family protein [Saccharopolyspora sp. ID03-671]|uniref:DUF3558 family protein n=1 Tax=Saccharopolyspora sp. ID03-671 TaxID=3073066 RepID=UPI0032551B41
MSDLMVTMRTTRFVAAVAVVAAGSVLAGCSGGGSAGETGQPAPQNVLAGFDPCKVDPQALGATAPGEPVDDGSGEQGCEFEAGDAIVAVYKGENDSLQFWEGQRDRFGVFEPNQVGARKGIKQVSKGAVGQGICNQVIEVGSGSVSVQVNNSGNEPNDDATCAKAMEIAQAVEPTLPK